MALLHSSFPVALLSSFPRRPEGPNYQPSRVHLLRLFPILIVFTMDDHLLLQIRGELWGTSYAYYGYWHYFCHIFGSALVCAHNHQCWSRSRVPPLSHFSPFLPLFAATISTKHFCPSESHVATRQSIERARWALSLKSLTLFPKLSSTCLLCYIHELPSLEILIENLNPSRYVGPPTASAPAGSFTESSVIMRPGMNPKSLLVSNAAGRILPVIITPV